MVAEIASSYGAIWDEFSEQPAPKNIKKKQFYCSFSTILMKI